ncbi:MAG: phospho-N-acetylmuramoyl-pentapeptide-transferase [Pseudomonadota bacterium]
MIYHLLYPLANEFIFFNVFRYITFRTVCATLTAMVISFILGPYLIRKLNHKQLGQQVRNDGPGTHLAKAGTPTMGGLLIISSILFSTLLWARLDNYLVWITIFVTASFALLGFLDDYKKIKKKNSKGVSGWIKILWQGSIIIVVAAYLYANGFSTSLNFPFFKAFRPELGLLYIPFAFLVVVGTSNSVNLTDGLDGLAIGPVLTSSICYIILSYVAGHYIISDYLGLIYVNGAGELAIISGTLLGAGLGFLWYNTYPAQVFMGDVGSLSLGGAIGTIALLTKSEILLILIGGVFVLETLSVVIQVISFKMTGKRVFKMAPIHHHFELKGIAEPKVIVRFWIVSIILALFALGTLKLR